MNTIIEIIILIIFFTIFDMCTDIHGKNLVYLCIINHVVAFLIALLLSRVIYEWIHKN
jgi:hypothetical protein